MKRKRQAGAGNEALPNDVSGKRGWKQARDVAAPTATKVPTRRVTINLDEDIIAVFKAEAFCGGPPYQVGINQALRAFVREREKSDADRAAETVLKALDQRAVVRKLRRVLEGSAA